jgi:DNA invertase Pin-like site-specific DNA recombinase
MEQHLRAFIYDRTSRDISGRGTANRDQNIENERLCREYGWEIVARFSDAGKGASRHARSKRRDYEEMVERLQRREADVLVVWEASRAYRDLEVYVQLRNLCTRHRVLLCYDGTVYDMTRSEDRYRTGQDALQAEREADKIRDRVLRTTRLNAERGRPHGRTPYGYRRVYDQDTGELLEQVPDEQQAPIVREIAERAAGGQSLYGIAQDLNDRGVPGPSGARWMPEVLPDLITKPTYIAKRQHQGIVIGDATWKPILTEEVYYACVTLFSDPARLTAKSRAIKYLLSGIAKCSVCKFVVRPRRSYDREKWSYTCVTCFKTQMRTPALDDIVTGSVLAHVERPEFVRALTAAAADDGAREALAEAEALEMQLAEARELAGRFANGRMALSALSLAKMEQELGPRIEGARQRAQAVTVPQSLRQIAGPGARERWAVMEQDLVWRRAVVKSVVVPWLNPAGKGVRTIKPGRYDLEWLY